MKIAINMEKKMGHSSTVFSYRHRSLLWASDLTVYAGSFRTINSQRRVHLPTYLVMLKRANYFTSTAVHLLLIGLQD